MTNTVCTFFELTEGEDTVAQPFYGLERELLLKSLRTLEKQHKAEIFESEDGVKFFQLWEQFFYSAHRPNYKFFLQWKYT